MEINYTEYKDILDFLKLIIDKLEDETSSFGMNTFSLDTVFKMEDRPLGPVRKVYNINFTVSEYI